MKKRLIVFLLALALLLGMAACGGNTDSGSDPTPAGTQSGSSGGDTQPDAGSAGADPVAITAAIAAIPNSLDPITDDISTTLSVCYHIYDKLIEFDLDFNWIPGVASSWKQLDSTHWEFVINTDLKFQNGDPLTMEDVEYSFTRLKDIPKSADAAAAVKSVSSEGNVLTVELVEADNGSLPRLLSILIIVNKAYLEENGDDAVYLSPIGTGPYKCTEFTPGTSVTLETWSEYPLEKPQIDKINFIGIAETSNLYIAVETGQAQYAGFVSAMEAETAEQNNKLSVLYADSNCVQTMCMNSSVAPFDNANVRRAMAHCIDREAWALLKGGRSKIESMVAIGFDQYYVSDNLPEFNPEKARELLAAEGYDESNPLSFTIDMYMSDPGVELFQSTLKGIGVECELSLLEFSVFIEKEGSGNFTMMYTANDNPAGTVLQDLQRFDPAFKATRNISFYENDEVTDLIAQARTTDDNDELNALFVEIQDIIADEVPMIPVFVRPLIGVMDNRLSGVIITANMIQSFRSAEYH